MTNIIEKLMVSAFEQKLDEAFLDGMREAARVLLTQLGNSLYEARWILDDVARRAKSGNVRQKTGLAERSDPEAQATPVKQGEAS